MGKTGIIFMVSKDIGGGGGEKGGLFCLFFVSFTPKTSSLYTTIFISGSSASKSMKSWTMPYFRKDYNLYYLRSIWNRLFVNWHCPFRVTIPSLPMSEEGVSFSNILQDNVLLTYFHSSGSEKYWTDTCALWNTATV